MKYRIVRSEYLRFKIQYKWNWWPFWSDHKHFHRLGFSITEWFDHYEEAVFQVNHFISQEQHKEVVVGEFN